jgi:hypothetical protein
MYMPTAKLNVLTGGILIAAVALLVATWTEPTRASGRSALEPVGAAGIGGSAPQVNASPARARATVPGPRGGAGARERPVRAVIEARADL